MGNTVGEGRRIRDGNGEWRRILSPVLKNMIGTVGHYLAALPSIHAEREPSAAKRAHILHFN
jgi:hypothetical protein